MKFVLSGVLILIASAVLCSPISGQGGWRQWDIHLLDGTIRVATPLAINEKGQFTFSMGHEPAIDRSKISYLAIRASELPPVPEGLLDKDMVVLTDGSRRFGPVKFRDLKFSEGIILQNGKEIRTENVAYIKFAEEEENQKTIVVTPAEHK